MIFPKLFGFSYFENCGGIVSDSQNNGIIFELLEDLRLIT